MRYLLVLLLFAAVPALAQERDSQSGEQAPAEPAPSHRIETSPSGVIVIRGGSQPAPAPVQEQEQEAAPEEGDAAESESTEGTGTEQAAGESGSSAPQGETRVIKRFGYDVNQDKTSVPQTTVVEVSQDTRLLVQKLLNSSKEEITYLREESRVIEESPGRKETEQVIQRYDPDGRPVRRQVIREEERTLADGTIVRTSTVYEENASGGLEPVERRVVREKTEGNKTTTTRTVERPSINRGFEPRVREKSVTVKQGEDFARTETTTMVAGGHGDMIQKGRSTTVMRKSGNQSTTETTAYEFDPVVNEMELAQRRVGRLVERPDGSATESVEVYGHSIDAGSNRVLSATGPVLMRAVQRDVSVAPDGRVVETSHTRTRSVADPSRMSKTSTAQRVAQMTEDGKHIETHVYEQGPSGGMAATEVVIEEVEEH